MRVAWRPVQQWPGELSKNRQMAPWGLTEGIVIRDLLKEVERLEPTSLDVVVQVAAMGGDSDFRVDGELKTRAFLRHPGVVVTIETSKLGTLSMACDQWRGSRSSSWDKVDVLANLRAVSLTLTALRAIERYGIGTGTEQYRGWAAIGPCSIALGPQVETMTADEARAVFDRLLRDGPSGGSVFPARIHPEMVDAAFKLAAKRAHPDAGGDPETFRRLVMARNLLANI